MVLVNFSFSFPFSFMASRGMTNSSRSPPLDTEPCTDVTAGIPSEPPVLAPSSGVGRSGADASFPRRDLLEFRLAPLPFCLDCLFSLPFRLPVVPDSMRKSSAHGRRFSTRTGAWATMMTSCGVDTVPMVTSDFPRVRHDLVSHAVEKLHREREDGGGISGGAGSTFSSGPSRKSRRRRTICDRRLLSRNVQTLGARGWHPCSKTLFSALSFWFDMSAMLRTRCRCTESRASSSVSPRSTGKDQLYADAGSCKGFPSSSSSTTGRH
mmetsp:Transcript_25137/g.70439  ORF Transcript_25137/g.70439 Transcript_25137/m.70439 type:complete len:266 (-) Transcript_25137:812-1609(-)